MAWVTDGNLNREIATTTGVSCLFATSNTLGRRTFFVRQRSGAAGPTTPNARTASAELIQTANL